MPQVIKENLAEIAGHPVEFICVFTIIFMAARAGFHFAGIFRMTRPPSIYEEAEEIFRNPDQFL